MSNLWNYEEIFQQKIIRDFMLPINEHALLGVAVQPIRGILFAMAIWPLRSLLLEKKYGWPILWQLFLVFGILSTTGAAPSSIEGVLYSKRWLDDKISVWVIFGLAYLIDSLVMFLYQWIFFVSSNLLYGLLICLLPAAMIAFDPQKLQKGTSLRTSFI